MREGVRNGGERTYEMWNETKGEGEGKGRLELRGALLGFPQPFCARLLTQQPCLLSSVAHA